MTGIIEFSSDTLNIEVSGINNNIPIDLVEVLSTGQDVYVNIESNYGPVLAVNGRIGFVTLNKSDVGLSNVENLSILGASGHLQYQIDQLDTGYVSQIEIDTLSGLLYQTGSYLYTTINNLSGAIVSGYATKIDLQSTGSFLYGLINSLSGYSNSTFYPKNNPSGFITGIDLSPYVTKTNGIFLNRPTLNGTGFLLSGEAASLPNTIVYTTGNQNISGLKDFKTRPTVTNIPIILSGEAYLSSNPSGYITNQNVVFTSGDQTISGSKTFKAERYIFSGANVIFVNNTGISSGYWQFTNRPTINSTGVLLMGEAYPLNNPSGYITGVNLSNYYTNDNPSGFITGVNLSNYVTKISGEFLDRPTVNGTGVLLSGEAAGSANFRYFPASGIANLLSNNRYSFDTLTGLVTGILPASPQKGDEIELYDSAGTWHINPLIVDNNGNYIEQKREMLECNVRHGLIKLIYTTQNNIGWRIYPMPIHNVPLFLPPSIAITGASLSGIVPFAIALTGASLLDSTQAPVDEWYWNLNTGDGYAISGQTIAYTYLQTGLYDVTLSGSNAAGFDVEHRFINVFLPYVPTVNVTSNKLSGIAPFTGQLSATNTTQPAQFSPVNNWYWDFDGDTVFDATGQNTTVVYNTTGTYTPTAYGVNLGGTGTGFITINVIPPLPPIPAISTSSISGFAPLTLTFTGVNLQTPAEFSPVDHWYWNISGDSAPEYDQRVITYTFNETGNYTFYLTAVNGGGSGVASGIFSILEVPPITTGTDPYSDYVTLLLHFN